MRYKNKNVAEKFCGVLLMPLDLVECVSRANALNKKTPAMRVGDKNYIKKASFALRCRCSSQSQ